MATTKDILVKMGATNAAANRYAAALDAAMAEFSINTPARKAMFLANIMHESGALARVTENLMYSAPRLLQVFPKYFPTAQKAAEYARKPEKIANLVYGNRMGNGGESSGDGYRFRGRGLIQLTGKENYTRCGTGLGVDLLTDPSYLEKPEGAARSAAWFWASRRLNTLADQGELTAIIKIINGGTNGFADRKRLYGIASRYL